jgi:dTMP kinase
MPRFVTLDGGEGAGKSTVLAALREFLLARGLRGGFHARAGWHAARRADPRPAAGHASRAPAVETELLLMFAARAQHVREVILPRCSAVRG